MAMVPPSHKLRPLVDKGMGFVVALETAAVDQEEMVEELGEIVAVVVDDLL